MEGLKVSDANFVVYVHPSKATNVSQAILRELSSLLFKFSEIFDGVVLAYDVNTLSDMVKILPGVHPYFGVRLQAKLLLFHPKTDMLLEGKEDIREELKYKVKHGEEVFVGTSHKWHKIKVGTILRFLVKSFDEEILHISGSLVPPHTGSVRWLDKNGEDWSQTDRSSKKRKESEGRQQIWGHDKPIIDASTLSMNTDHANKKSKKRRRNEDS